MSGAPRFDLAELEPADDRRVRMLWGREPINLYRVLAHHPRLLRAWTEWNDELRQGCSLPRALRELIFLRSAVLHRCDYEWIQHMKMARAAGVAEDKIATIDQWETSELFDRRERTALLATDQVIANDLGNDAFDALRAAFTPAESLEIIVTAAHSCMLGRVIQAVAVTAHGEVDG